MGFLIIVFDDRGNKILRTIAIRAIPKMKPDLLHLSLILEIRNRNDQLDCNIFGGIIF